MPSQGAHLVSFAGPCHPHRLLPPGFPKVTAPLQVTSPPGYRPRGPDFAQTTRVRLSRGRHPHAPDEPVDGVVHLLLLVTTESWLGRIPGDR